jgi:ElaB/YqjD/DUF883 family membrane-anchored ribosome-binding protein
MSEYKGNNPELAYEPADLGVDSEIESRSERSPQEIEREIEQTRNRMSRNIDELGDRLSPSNLKQEAKSAIKGAAQGAVSNVGEQARRTSSRLVEVIRENPLPVIAVGAGVTWLLTQRSRSDISGDRMARYAYTGPERRQGDSWQSGSGIRGKVGGAVSDVKESVSEVAERAGELKDRAGERIGEIGGQARWQTRRIKTNFEHTADENPLMLALGAAVVGLALGMLLPGTQREDEIMGSARDQLVDRAEETVERAKEAAVEAGREVKETVKSEFEQHKPELKEVVQQAGQNVKEQVKESARRVKSEAKDAAKKSGNSPRSNS